MKLEPYTRPLGNQMYLYPNSMMSEVFRHYFPAQRFYQALPGTNLEISNHGRDLSFLPMRGAYLNIPERVRVLARTVSQSGPTNISRYFLDEVVDFDLAKISYESPVVAVFSGKLFSAHTPLCSTFTAALKESLQHCRYVVAMDLTGILACP